MFDWDADPHKGAPYVQMSFSTLLYIISLLARDNLDLRPKAQYIRCSNSPRWGKDRNEIVKYGLVSIGFYVRN